MVDLIQLNRSFDPDERPRNPSRGSESSIVLIRPDFEVVIDEVHRRYRNTLEGIKPSF